MVYAPPAYSPVAPSAPPAYDACVGKKNDWKPSGGNFVLKASETGLCLNYSSHLLTVFLGREWYWRISIWSQTSWPHILYNWMELGFFFSVILVMLCRHIDTMSCLILRLIFSVLVILLNIRNAWDNLVETCHYRKVLWSAVTIDCIIYWHKSVFQVENAQQLTSHSHPPDLTLFVH